MSQQGEPQYVFSGKRMRHARRRKSLSQTDLAKMIGVHRTSVVRWESNLIEPPQLQVQKMAQVLERDPASFYELVPAEPQPAEEEPKQEEDWLEQHRLERLQELTPQALRNAIRVTRGSIYSLARQLGETVDLVRDWIAGRLKPDFEQIKRMRFILGPSFDPSPTAARRLTKNQPAPKPRFANSDLLSVDDKLDIIIRRLNRLENLIIEVLEKDVEYDSRNSRKH